MYTLSTQRCSDAAVFIRARQEKQTRQEKQETRESPYTPTPSATRRNPHARARRHAQTPRGRPRHRRSVRLLLSEAARAAAAARSQTAIFRVAGAQGTLYLPLRHPPHPPAPFTRAPPNSSLPGRCSRLRSTGIRPRSRCSSPGRRDRRRGTSCWSASRARRLAAAAAAAGNSCHGAGVAGLAAGSRSPVEADRSPEAARIRPVEEEDIRRRTTAAGTAEPGCSSPDST